MLCCVKSFFALLDDEAALVPQGGTQSGLALGGNEIFFPFGLGRIGLAGEDFNLVAALELVGQRHEFVVDFACDAVGAQVGV